MLLRANLISSTCKLEHTQQMHSKNTKHAIINLQVYDLGADGQGMTRVASVSQNSIVSAAGKIAR